MNRLSTEKKKNSNKKNTFNHTNHKSNASINKIIPNIINDMDQQKNIL